MLRVKLSVVYAVLLALAIALLGGCATTPEDKTAGLTSEKLYSEARAYIQYKRDASTMYTPIDRPIYSAENDKTLELKPWF